jgi:hypothetical protein
MAVSSARHLIAAGADPNLEDPERVPPLNMALLDLHFEVAASPIVEHRVGCLLDRHGLAEDDDRGPRTRGRRRCDPCLIRQPDDATVVGDARQFWNAGAGTYDADLFDDEARAARTFHRHDGRSRS